MTSFQPRYATGSIGWDRRGRRRMTATLVAIKSPSAYIIKRHHDRNNREKKQEQQFFALLVRLMLMLKEIHSSMLNRKSCKI